MSTNKIILKKSTVLTSIGFFFQIIGLFFMVLVAKKFGANAQIDAYYYIIAIHFFLITIFQNVFKILLLPILIFEKNNNPQEINLLFNNLIIGFSIIALLITLIVIGIANLEIAHLLFPNNLSIDYFKNLLYLSSPLIFLNVISGVLINIYNSFQKFGMLEVIYNSRIFISFLFFYYFSDVLHVHSLILGNILGQFLVLIISIYYMTRKQYLNFKVQFRFHKSLSRISKLSLIPLLSVIFVALQPILINYFLSYNNIIGSISLFSYAQKIASIPTVIFSSGMLTVFVSHLSVMEVKNNYAEIRNTTTKSVSLLITLILPVVIFLALTNYEIAAIIFYNTNFSNNQLFIIGNTTVLLLVSFSFLQIHSLISRIFIVKQNTLFLFFLSIISFLIQIISTYLFVVILNFKTYGVSFSLVVTNFIILCLSMFYNINKYNSIEIKYIFMNLWKSITAILILFTLKYFIDHKIFNLIHNVLFTILYKLFFVFGIYLSVLFYLKQKDILLLFSKVNIFKFNK